MNITEKISTYLNESDYITDVIGFGKELKPKLSSSDYNKLNDLLQKQDKMAGSMKSKAVQQWEDSSGEFLELSDFIQNQNDLVDILRDNGKSKKDDELYLLASQIQDILKKVK